MEAIKKEIDDEKSDDGGYSQSVGVASETPQSVLAKNEVSVTYDAQSQGVTGEIDEKTYEAL